MSTKRRQSTSGGVRKKPGPGQNPKFKYELVRYSQQGDLTSLSEEERERKAEFERLYHRSAQEVRDEVQRLTDELARETHKNANELARVQLAAHRAAHDASMEEQRATTDQLFQIDLEQLELKKKIA